MRHGARLGFRPITDGQEHAPNDVPMNAPQEVRLILPWVETTIERAIDDPGVVTGRNPARVDRVGLVEQIAELRESVAPHAGNRRAASRVLVDEVIDDVTAERALQVEHVVRYTELLADASRVIDRVKGATRSIRDVVTVAEQLHRRADDIVALLDEQCRGDGRIDPAGHRHQHPLSHRQAPTACGRAAGDWPRALRTRLGKTCVTRSIEASVVRLPRLMRIAALAMSGRTPHAVSTCDGVTLPL